MPFWMLMDMAGMWIWDMGYEYEYEYEWETWLDETNECMA